MAARILLDGVTIRRGGRTLVEGVTARIRAGSILWLTGPNGSGKSSLLRVLAGLERPAAGLVRREGGGDRRVVYDPGMRLPPGATAGAWLRLVGRLGRSGWGADRLRAPGAGRRKRVRALSTGEEKRLVLEAVLSARASFVLLDEPFGHLSPDGRAALGDLLRERSRDSVVVVATNRPPPIGSGDAVLRLGAEPTGSLVPPELRRAPGTEGA